MLSLLGLSEQETLAISAFVGLKDKTLSLQDIKDTGMLAALEKNGQGELLSEVIALASGQISAANWEDSTLLKSLDLSTEQLGAVSLVMDVSQNGLTFTTGKIEALLVGQGVTPAKAKTAAGLIDLQFKQGDYSFDEIKATGVFDDLDLTPEQMEMIKAAAALAPSAKNGQVDAATQLQSLMALTELPLMKDGTTLGDQVANILPALL